MKKNFLKPAALTALGILASSSSHAVVYNWLPGTGGNSQVANGANWQGGVAPTVNSGADSFVFGLNGNKPNPTMQGLSYNVGGISFVSGANSYTLNGGGVLTIGASGFLNDSINNQTFFNTTVNVGTAQSWNANAGDLTFSGTSLTLGGNTLTLTGGNDFFIQNAISGTGGLNKTGNGTVTLSGANTYSGGTTISAGTVYANNLSGSATGSGTVTVNGGRLSGSGSLSGAVALNSGSLGAGNNGAAQRVGQIALGDLTLNGGQVVVEINDADAGAGAGWDLINAASLTLGGGSPIVIDVTTLTLANSQGLLADFDSAQAYTWEIIRTVNGITGFSESAFDIQLGNFVNDTGMGDFNVFSDGQSVFLNFTPVPEPSTVAFGAVAGAMLLGSMLRRKKK